MVCISSSLSTPLCLFLLYLSAFTNLNITQVFSFQPGKIIAVTFCPVQTIKATSHLGDPRVTYNLEDGMVPETNMPVRFYLSPNREDGSASILVSEPLDYETTSFFSLRVRAQNVAAVPLAAFTTVYVNITGMVCFLPISLHSLVGTQST